MRNIITITSRAATVLLVCAAGTSAAQTTITTEKRDFIFDYTVAGKSQQDLFRSARNYLATAYGDSRAVSRVEDAEQGTLIGKGVVAWGLTVDGFLVKSIPCSSNYDIVFIAKDGRARLQLSLKEGSVSPRDCNWPLPPTRDYPQIVSHFKGISADMEKALNGQAPIDALRNF